MTYLTRLAQGACDFASARHRDGGRPGPDRAARAATPRSRPPAATPRSAPPTTSTRRTRRTLQQGGNLRLALTGFPPNFNSLHIDGNLGGTRRDAAGDACRGRSSSARRRDDGQHRLLHQRRTDQHRTRRSSPTPSTRRRCGRDGTPITWEDIAAQINATSGKDKRFLIASPNGSDRVASVTQGVDDRQAVITFAKHYADWRGMFAGNTMLLPKTMTQNPEAFNKGFLNGPGPSAGPFIITTLDRTAQRIVLTRNPKWWGAPPLLDTITYPVLDDAATYPGAAEQRHRRHRSGFAGRAGPSPGAPRASRSGGRPRRAGITSRSTAPRGRSWPTRRCGPRSPRASTARPSPRSRSAAWSTTRCR